MTDLSLAPPVAARRAAALSKTAENRLRARYRAEARFKFYGLAALAVAATFVVVLLVDILSRGLPGFWRHTLVLDVPVKADVVDPQGARDPSVIRRADYFPLTRAALEAAIPSVEGRAARKALTGLLSVGAADDLRRAIADNPTLIGTTVTSRLLLSDDADLYFKNPATPIRSRPAEGAATPSGASGEITVTSSASDFASEVALLKQRLDAQAVAASAEADRLERSGGTDGASRVGELRAEASAFREKATNPSGEMTLDGRMPSLLVAIHGGLVKATKVTPNSITGEVLLPLASSNAAAPDAWKIVTYEVAESNRKVRDQDIAFLERLRELGKVEGGFNWRFFSAGDSREPELAGVKGALVGTALTLLVTLVLCLPIGVAAAVYLEEFAAKNWLTDIIEVNINNLAAVPSIVFGLLGLAVFLNFFGLPRSAPLVGGLVLALLVLPTIIIAARAALKAVPPSIKEAALGVGASHQQAIFHHVLPLAMPGIMTGTIIGMAHALGETAPLLMIGMVAFIVDVPGSLTDSATVLPVQIFLWSDLPEAAFKAKTAAAIIVLLAFLFAMNGLAIYLRRAFERRW